VFIKLSEKEMKFLQMLAHGRCSIKNLDNPNRPSQMVFGNTHLEADLIGIMGEYMVSKTLKVPFDTSIHVEGDGQVMDLLYGPYELQVKSTKYKTGKMLFFRKEELKADIFILCICITDQALVDIAGYISKEDALIKGVNMDLGRGMRFVVEQRHLKPITELEQVSRDII
jgi:hypothetical protein